MSAFPAVATVIGVSKEVAESGPFLATLAVDPGMMVAPPVPPMEQLVRKSEQVEIKAGDPVTQAVVDNIIGKLPTKKEPVLFKCDVCNITVSSLEVLENHYSGAKHAKKIKGQELIKEITNSPNSSFVVTSPQNSSGFSCNICKVQVNSYQQLLQHLTGLKHKTKAESKESNMVQVNDNRGGNQGVVNVDIGPNRLYCAACNVHVNSDLQLHQHIMSDKHASKVNGKVNYNRGLPYTRRSPKGVKTVNGNSNIGISVGNRGGNWNSTGGKRNSKWNDMGGKSINTGGWQPTGSELGLNYPRERWTSRKQFVSGGTLSY